MKILIIGGTRFLGPHFVVAALARNHEITLFNRGNHPAPLEVEIIRGDRHRDLNKLQGRTWDVVVDTCCYLPRTILSSAQLLSNSVDRYVLISSQSVYADFSVCGIDESSPLQSLTSDQIERANNIDSSGQVSAVTYGEMYGGLKALSEQAVEGVMPDRVLTIRPGVIVGPGDHLDRFTYWVMRVARGGEVLAPGWPDRTIQFIDVRDLAEWTVRMIEKKSSGIYNATGMPDTLTMQSLLNVCKKVSDSNAYFTWVDDQFLLQEKVEGWSEMPLWFPQDDAFKGFMFISIEKARSAGLTFRPLSETVRSTLDWYRSSKASRELKAGIDIAKERILLRKWNDRH